MISASDKALELIKKYGKKNATIQASQCLVMSTYGEDSEYWIETIKKISEYEDTKV